MPHLIDCISGDAPELASADHAIHVLDILAAARSSAARGKLIELESTPRAGAGTRQWKPLPLPGKAE